MCIEDEAEVRGMLKGEGASETTAPKCTKVQVRVLTFTEAVDCQSP